MDAYDATLLIVVLVILSLKPVLNPLLVGPGNWKTRWEKAKLGWKRGY